jgi:hypothetical protein
MQDKDRFPRFANLTWTVLLPGSAIEQNANTRYHQGTACNKRVSGGNAEYETGKCGHVICNLQNMYVLGYY